MKVTLVSSFRNASHYIKRYVKQVTALRDYLHEDNRKLSLVLGYGDSSDDTEQMLKDLMPTNIESLFVDVSHGGPEFGSVVHPVRFAQLSFIGNRMWERIPKDAKFVGLVESDLVWEGATLACLVDHVEALRSVDNPQSSPTLLAPMIKHRDGRFYDTWAFRAGGEHFRNQPPYHVGLTQRPSHFMEMDSVGSVVFMDGDIARKVCFPPDDVVVGLCKQAKALGARIFLDRSAEVYHP